METPEKAMKIQNFTSQKNAVMVMGYPKSGSHLILSILDELGKYNFSSYGKVLTVIIKVLNESFDRTIKL